MAFLLNTNEWKYEQSRPRWWSFGVKRSVIQPTGVSTAELETIAEQYLEISTRGHADQEWSSILLDEDVPLVRDHLRQLKQKQIDQADFEAKFPELTKHFEEMMQGALVRCR